MSKRRVKQQNVSVIGLFKLAGRHKKMHDVFVYHECQSTTKINSAKNEKHKLNHKQRLSRVFYFVCLFFMCLSYTFCLAVRFNCTKRTVFTKAPIFPAYSTNIVIVIFNKWLPLLSDLGHPFAAHGLPFYLFLPVLTSGHPKCKRMKEWNISMWASGLTNTVCLDGLQDNG